MRGEKEFYELSLQFLLTFIHYTWEIICIFFKAEISEDVGKIHIYINFTKNFHLKKYQVKKMCAFFCLTHSAPYRQTGALT